MKKRILILEFRQETNTFNPVVSQLSDFNDGKAFVGESVLQSRLRVASAVHGAVTAITEAGGEYFGTVFMAAASGGRVSDQAFAYLQEQVTQFAAAGEFDAIFASLHGATCTESCDDACGELAQLLRKLAGTKPVAASFDLHANITEKVLKNLDVICGYQSYPHRDLYESGYRAGKLCMDMLAGGRFSMASASVPMLIPPAGYTSDEGAFAELMNWGKELMAQGKILDFTLFPVQPWLDIPEIISRTVVIARDDATALDYAAQMAQKLCDLRDEAQPELMTVDQVIDLAEQNQTGKPVIVSEFADSPNGGCVGDSPVIPMRVLERGSKVKTCVFVRDPEAVAQAFRVGIGGTATFRVGAAFTPDMPGPLVAEGRVRSLHDGTFMLEGPANRGTLSFLGLSAVVSFGNVDILLTNFGGNSGDPQHFRHFGIEPGLYDLVVVKANTSFRLPYSKISPLIVCADTPGAGAADLCRFTWKKLPQGMYPMVADIAPNAPQLW